MVLYVGAVARLGDAIKPQLCMPKMHAEYHQSERSSVQVLLALPGQHLLRANLSALVNATTTNMHVLGGLAGRQDDHGRGHHFQSASVNTHAWLLVIVRQGPKTHSAPGIC